jgi:Ca2+-binding EF-hand superfamily protein
VCVACFVRSFEQPLALDAGNILDMFALFDRSQTGVISRDEVESLT